MYGLVNYWWWHSRYAKRYSKQASKRTWTRRGHWKPIDGHEVHIENMFHIYIYMYIYILVSYNPSSYMFSSDNAISRHSNNTSLHPAAIPSQVQRARWSSLGEQNWKRSDMNERSTVHGFLVLYQVTLVFGWYCTCFLVWFCLSPIE